MIDETLLEIFVKGHGFLTSDYPHSQDTNKCHGNVMVVSVKDLQRFIEYQLDKYGDRLEELR